MSEDIRYTFTGDASSLEKASQQAVDALKRVEQAEQSVANANGLEAVSAEVRQLASYYNLLNSAQEYYNRNMMMLLAGANSLSAAFENVSRHVNYLMSLYGGMSNATNLLGSSSSRVTGYITETSSAMQSMALVPANMNTALQTTNSYLTGYSNQLQQASMYTQMYTGSMLSANPAISSTALSLGHVTQQTKQFLAPIIQAREGADAYGRSMNQLSNYVDLAGGSSNNFRTRLKSANKEIDNTDKKAKKAGTSMSSFGNVFKKVMGQLAAYVSLQQIAKALAECITLSNEYIETLNLFEVASGNFKDSLQANADVLTYYGGLSRATVLNATGSFKLLTTEMGVVEDKSAQMAASLTNVAVDLSSLFNKDFESVMENLESGLQGMSRAVRKYGIDITEASLAETAAQLGIKKSIENMSQAEKVQLRYATIIRQTSLAQTDFAHTITAPANQIKILKEQVKECGVAIGNALQPLLETVLPGLIRTTFVVQELCNALATFVGYQPKDRSRDTADNYEDAADSLGTASDNAKKIKKSLAGFDELNILSQNTATEEDSSSGKGDLGFEIPTYDNLLAMSDFLPTLRTEAQQIAESFKTWVKPIADAFGTLKETWDTAFASIKSASSQYFDSWSSTLQQLITTVVVPIIGTLLEVIGQLAPIFSDILTQLNPVILVIGQLVSELVSSLAPVITTIASSLLPPLVQLITTVVTMVADFISAILPALTPFLQGIIECVGTLVSALLPVVTELLQLVFDILTPIINTILPPLLSLIQSVVSVVTQVLQAILPSLMGLLEAILVPLGEIIQELIPFLVNVLNRLLPIIGSLLAEILPPLLDIVTAIIKPLMQILQDILVPIIELLVTILEPILEVLIVVIKAIMAILTPIIKILVNIIDVCLQPLILVLEVLVEAILWVADIVAQAIDLVVRLLDWFINIFNGIINGVLAAIQWVVDAFRWLVSGVRDLMHTLGTVISNVFESIVNGIIWAINKVIGGIEWLINGALSLLNPLIKGLNYIPGVDIPALKVSLPKIPQLALGGVVTGPTILEAGEGKYDEAIVPLGDSPQLDDMLNRFAQKVDDLNASGGGNTEVHVYVDSDEVAARTEKRKKRDDIIFNGGK